MSTPDYPTTEIIQKAIDGDTAAVGILYESYAENIYRYIAYRVPTDADAEDLTAEVFVKMVEGLPAYRITGAPFEAWLYRIAAARVADFHRKKSRQIDVELHDSYATNKPLPEELMEQTQEVQKLRRAMQQLTDEQQTVLILRFMERKSHDEVANVMEKSVSAVKSIQHRALLRISSLLGTEKSRHYLRGSQHD